MTVNSRYMKELAVFREKLPCCFPKTVNLLLGDIFSPLDFAFVNSMAEIDTSLSYALWNGQMANCFIPVSRIGISSRASQKAAAEKFVEYLFSEEGQMLSREDGFPVVESVYNGKDYWNRERLETC